MAAAPFSSLGEKPHWQLLYERIRDLRTGELITYEEIEQIIGTKFFLSRSSYYRAVQELRRSDSRSMTNVRGLGYRVVEPIEQMALARRHNKRARRQFSKAKSEIHYADRRRLPPGEAAKFDEYEARLSQLETLTRVALRKVVATEKRVGTTEVGQQRLERDMARVLGALERAGLLEETRPAKSA